MTVPLILLSRLIRALGKINPAVEEASRAPRLQSSWIGVFSGA